MNRRCIWIVLVFSVLLSNPASADNQSANRVTPINKAADFLATVGKSDRDKKEILEERKAIRRDVRLKEEARRKRAETRKRMLEQQQEIMRKINAQ